MADLSQLELNGTTYDLKDATARALLNFIHVGASAPTDPNVKIWLDTDEPGMSGVSSVNNKTGTVVLDADDVGAMSEWVLLWENASPTSAFAAQTVSLDLSNYDAVFVDSISYATEDPHITCICPKGIQTRIFRANAAESSNAKMWIASREATVSNSGVVFSKALQSTVTANEGTVNNALIPFRIYGFKGVVTA